MRQRSVGGRCDTAWRWSGPDGSMCGRWKCRHAELQGFWGRKAQHGGRQRSDARETWVVQTGVDDLSRIQRCRSGGLGRLVARLPDSRTTPRVLLVLYVSG